MIKFEELTDYKHNEDEIVKQLRDLADHIEKKQMPYLFFYKSERTDAGYDFSISLSYPWGG